MAGKHSKSLFDFKKSAYAAPKSCKPSVFSTISPPFKVILLVFVLVLVATTILITAFFMQSSSHDDILSDAKATFYSGDSSATLKLLAQQNPDIKGWLKIDGTNIDCAVCQAKDNKYYMEHNQLREESRHGALFLQNNDIIDRANDDKNIVIYGNNMQDSTMFGTLKEYRKLNFYKSNPYIELYYGDQAETYAVFSVMLISSMDDDGGRLYKPYKSYFTDDNDFNAWLEETRLRSIINTTINVENGDNILTLVTTADDFNGARLVVMAKQIDELDTELNVYGASFNPKPKYPKIWYTTKGYEYPY